MSRADLELLARHYADFFALGTFPEVVNSGFPEGTFKKGKKYMIAVIAMENEP